MRLARPSAEETRRPPDGEGVMRTHRGDTEIKQSSEAKKEKRWEGDPARRGEGARSVVSGRAAPRRGGACSARIASFLLCIVAAEMPQRRRRPAGRKKEGQRGVVVEGGVK